jgi:hypothetical protein
MSQMAMAEIWLSLGRVNLMSQIFESRRSARYIASIGVISTLSTAIAMLTGVCFVAAITVPTSLALFLMPALLIQVLVYACQYLAPVTLALLPATAIAFGGRTNLALIVLPVVGMAGGAMSILARHLLTSSSLPGGPGFAALLAASMIAGLAGGGFFGHALHELNK